MSKDLHLFLIRFWAGIVLSFAMGLAYDRHQPRLVWGMFVGSFVWLVILLMTHLANNPRRLRSVPAPRPLSCPHCGMFPVQLVREQNIPPRYVPCGHQAILASVKVKSVQDR